MPLSPADNAWLLQREGAEPGIELLTLTGDMLISPEHPDGIVRLCKYHSDVISRGNTFTVSDFEFSRPEESDQQPVAKLTVANVDRLIGLSLIEASMNEAPTVIADGLTVLFEMVRPADFNAVIYAADKLKLRNVSIDPLIVEGGLSVAQLDKEPYGSLRMVPAHFPWLDYA